MSEKALVKNVKTVAYKAGNVIFDIDTSGDEIYLIHSGTVNIISREGLKLSEMGEGELFGEMASVLSEHHRSASAVAATDCVINVLSASSMKARLAEADPVLRALIRSMTIRIIEANEMNEKYWTELGIYKALHIDKVVT
ncbi:MAG: cyclic nucleotide-binding domain-containing protein [Rhodobiaceae bacterium]|jgi:CRP-like cAMP-binding protein|nr:cyclic nucleotide-binding domain-containing protein [Alphaproteobacteria bacterium]